MPKPSRSVGFYLLLLCVLAAANVSIYQIILAPHTLAVTVLPVGKGSATLVRTFGGKTLLIDTGPDASILRELGTALPEWERSIDTVILTGSKASFSGGLPALESRYHIKNRIRIGDQTVPYGTEFTFGDSTDITIISAGIFSISHGAASLLVSSSTPPKTYVLK